MTPSADPHATRSGPRAGRPRPTRGTQVLTFLWIGGVSWALQMVLYLALRSFAAPQVANVVALGLATIVNTWANGRWTFGERRRDGIRRRQVQGLAIVAGTWAMTAGALALLHTARPAPPTLVETLVVGATTVLATTAKFLIMRRWVFGPGSERSPATADDAPALPEDTSAGYPVGASGGVA